MTRASGTSRRDERTQATRQRIIDAARDLLLSGGYARMTIAHLAQAAGVSAQTVYNSVGGKADVVKAVYDVMLAGDADPIPLSSRPQFRAVREAVDVDSWSAAYAASCRMVMQRIGPLLGVLLAHGPGGDPILEQLVATMDQERRTGNEHSLSALAERGLVPPEHARRKIIDAVWVLTAPEVYDRFVRRAGWTPAAYEKWLASQLRAALAHE